MSVHPPGAGAPFGDAGPRPRSGEDADAIVTVSPMRPRHLPGVLAIEAAVYPKPWSLKLFQDELARNRPYLVVRVGPQVVGYAGLLMIADDGHVATVAVDPLLQGRHLATRLLIELFRQAIIVGANQLTLEVRMSNVRAQGIYRRFGFVPAGARKGYYGDDGEDALVMWAHDITTDSYRHRLAAVEASLPTPTRRSGFERGPDTAPTAPPRPAETSRPAHPAAVQS